MSMTSELRDELVKASRGPDSCRRAQAAAMLRMGGEVRVSRNGLKVTVETPSAATARYLRRELRALHKVHPVATVMERDGHAPFGPRYQVTVSPTDGGGALARSARLIDHRGEMVWGLPALVVGGSPGDIAAALRGAFLMVGTLSGPLNAPVFEIKCPSAEAAHALSSCARRLGVNPMVREIREVHRMLVREPDDIAALLTAMGASSGRMVWERRAARQGMVRRANLERANVCRATRAAATTATKVADALEILGDAAPEHLADTAKLRIAHRDASLEELGRLADPPLTKDSVAGRLRRLLTLADKHTADAAPRLPVLVAAP